MELLEKLKKIKNKFDQINQQLSDPDVLSDRERVVNLSRERSELTEIIQVYDDYSDVVKNIDGNN